MVCVGGQSELWLSLPSKERFNSLPMPNYITYQQPSAYINSLHMIHQPSRASYWSTRDNSNSSNYDANLYRLGEINTCTHKSLLYLLETFQPNTLVY